MLNFVNIENELSYQDKEVRLAASFGIQIANNIYPIDFQYQSDESISSFTLIDKTTLEETSLSTALITADGEYHKCDGLTAYAESLACGIYYFLVNGKYQSEDFEVYVFTDVLPGLDSIISVEGTYFYDITKDEPEWTKKGAVYARFASEYSTNIQPNKFRYISTEAVSTFELLKIDENYNILETTTLDTGLIESVDGYHTCSGLIAYTSDILPGLYYYRVNDKYYSSVFEIFSLVCITIENIVITNAIEGETGNIAFDAYVTGENAAKNVTLTISFSNSIDDETEVTVLTPLSTSFSIDFTIPSGSSGSTSVTITNTICAKIYTEQFIITPVAVPCLQLFGGGELTLFGGGCLQLFE